MDLEQLLKETDSLTYINALKVILLEIKDELSTQDELAEYMNSSREKTRKLLRKADNHYRLISKLVKREAPTVTNVTVENSMEDFDNIKELMEDE